MSLQLLKSTTLTLTAIAFLALEKLTNNSIFWMLGIMSFIAVSIKLFLIESREINQSQIIEKVFRS